MESESVIDVPPVIPMPVSFKVKNGGFELKEGALICCADDASGEVAELLAMQLRLATGFELPVHLGVGGKGNITFQFVENVSLGAEGYELCVTDSVHIVAQSVAGLFYGAQTFRQLLPPDIFSVERVSVAWLAPAVDIRDVPRFGWRGLMLDCGRYFMPKEGVKRFIDTMASLKFNVLHWHLTEDQGWRVEIKKYPLLTQVGAWRSETQVGHLEDFPRVYDGVPHGGFYTQAEVREIVAYAAVRQVTIVPEIDMPGHMQAAIAAYPEFGCSREGVVEVRREWGVSEDILSPEAGSVQFCKDVLTEILELFPSEYIHVGGDEALKKQWEVDCGIQQLREDRGLRDMHEMQSWFIRKIDDFLVTKGRRLIGWDEISEGGLAENAVVMWWRGSEGVDVAVEAAQGGHDIIVASNKSLYFDEAQDGDSKEPLAHRALVIRLEDVYSFEPVIDGLEGHAASCVLGAQGQLWTEYMPTMRHVEYMAYPRACALAEVLWLPEEKKDYAHFLERLKVQERRFAAAGINFRQTR